MVNDDFERLLSTIQSGPSATDWIAAISAAITALVAIGALIYAAKQIREAKAARVLTQDLETQRAQPYVVVYTEESEATNLAIDLVVKNFGPTAAKDVKIALEPWPERDGRDDAGARVGIPEFPVLAPGQEWRTSWVWGPDREKSLLPDLHEGTVSFRGIDDAALSTPIVLDLKIYTGREWVEVRGIHDAAKALRDISKNQKKWTEGLNGPLSVLVRDGAEKDSRERARLEKLKQQRAAHLASQQQSDTAE